MVVKMRLRKMDSADHAGEDQPVDEDYDRAAFEQSHALADAPMIKPAAMQMNFYSLLIGIFPASNPVFFFKLGGRGVGGWWVGPTLRNPL